MAEIIRKTFLDEEGLALYDQLIKAYIDEATGSSEELQQALSDIQENSDAIAILNGDDETEGSVAKQVKDAIADLVDGAPETLDTLKELATWVEEHEDISEGLVESIRDLEEKNEELKEYIDVQDNYFYNSIQSIENLKIAALFPENQSADVDVATAIESLDEGKAIKLIADQTINQPINITKSCYIDANGSVFTDTVTIPADVDVVIENATFSNPVVIA